ncbi:Plasma membrane fusion protein PRM1 [Cytospora mali]|uniref:Plasma membrane fusion protein PRM1 n=1 Tax=Cytospora mali TaxID=578113 RepID=A0A194VCS0_CYTMA|nr:Plasma membrane fusion protein PRM1 [Valsa mali var. pyri (nom. inval.)]
MFFSKFPRFSEKPPQPEPQLQEASWPSVPPSLSHQSFDLDNGKQADATAMPPRPHYNASEITPYLGLRSRLSQVPMNRWTVLLLLVLARLLILLAGLNTDLVNAKENALSSCTKVEDIGSSMASMPHYLSVGVNQLAADGITKTVQGMVEILMMILTGVQELIFFWIEFEIGTFMCLCTALVNGVLDFAEFAINGTTALLNEAVHKVASGIEDAVDAVVEAAKVFKIDLSDIETEVDKLSDVQIDTSSIVSGIKDLNSKINYTDIQNDVQEAIAIPFDMVKRLLNESYGSWEFNQSVFPVAEKETLSFCSNNSTLDHFFEVLFKICASAKTVVIVVLVLLAIIAAAFMAWWEIKRFNRQLVKSQILSNREPMDIAYIAGRPLTAGAGIWISEKLSRDPKRQVLIRWVVAYATTYTALFVLSLAIAGAFSCFCQWVILRAIQKEAPALAAEVGDFASEVVVSLEQASTQWANDSNSLILGLQNDINDDVFKYVRNATTAVNDTINTFDEYMQKGLDTVFGGVPQLEKFMSSVIACLITDKLDKVQEGLDWVTENAQVTLPLFSADIFSVGANDSINGDSDLTSFLSTPSSATTDEITEAVDKVIEMLRNNIIQEALISLVLFLVYIAYVFFAVAQAAIRCCLPDRVDDVGGQRPFDTGKSRGPMIPQSPPPRFPEFGGGAVPETPVDAAARDVHNPFANEKAVEDEKTGYALRDSRDRLGVPTQQQGHWRQSECGWIESDK